MIVNKRKVAAIQEREFSELFDLNTTPGSGSVWYAKDDARSKHEVENKARVRAELKGVAGGSYKLDPRVFLDLESRAISYDCIPIVGVRFFRGRPHAVNVCIVDAAFPLQPTDGTKCEYVVPSKTTTITPLFVGDGYYSELVWTAPPRGYIKTPRLIVLKQESVRKTIHDLRNQ